MISYYLTRNGEPISAGTSKDPNNLTIGTANNNDVVVSDISAGERFLIVTIAGSQLKLKCIDFVDGLKMYGIGFNVGQEKIISGSGGIPIEISDYVLEIKIGEPNSLWAVADVKKGKKEAGKHVDTFGASEQDREQAKEFKRRESEKPKPTVKPQPTIEKPLGQEIDALFDDEPAPKPKKQKPTEKEKQKDTYRKFLDDDGLSEIIKPEKMKAPGRSSSRTPISGKSELYESKDRISDFEKKQELKQTPKVEKTDSKPIVFADDDEEFMTTERLKKELSTIKEESKIAEKQTSAVDYDSDDDFMGVADSHAKADAPDEEFESEIFELQTRTEESSRRDFNFKLTDAEEKAMDKLEEELTAGDYEDDDFMSFAEKPDKITSADKKLTDEKKAVFGASSALPEIEPTIQPEIDIEAPADNFDDFDDQLMLVEEPEIGASEGLADEISAETGEEESPAFIDATVDYSEVEEIVNEPIDVSIPHVDVPSAPAPKIAVKSAEPPAPPMPAAAAPASTIATGSIAMEEPPAEPEPQSIPEKMPEKTSAPKHKKRKRMKMSANKAGSSKPDLDARISDVDYKTEKPASSLVGGFAGKQQSDIERKTTVRYYEQMSTSKNFPLLVLFTKEKVQEIVQKHVAQVQAKEKVKIKRDKPVVTVVPQFPGCLCVPEKIELDLTPEETEAKFWLTPVAEGNLIDAHVDVYYEGKKIQNIACKTKVAKTTAAKISASAAVISPIFFSAIESVGFDPKTQVESGFPIVKQLADLMEEISQTIFGSQIAGGMTLLGLSLGFIALVVAVLFFVKAKPKKGSPIDNFLSFDVNKEKIE